MTREQASTPADWRTYTPHPAASMWPMATRAEYEDLKASIAATGLAVPILKSRGGPDGSGPTSSIAAAGRSGAG